jgi:hypothetical protein
LKILIYTRYVCLFVCLCYHLKSNSVTAYTNRAWYEKKNDTTIMGGTLQNKFFAPFTVAGKNLAPPIKIRIYGFRCQNFCIFMLFRSKIGRINTFFEEKKFFIFFEILPWSPKLKKIEIFRKFLFFSKTCFLGFSGLGNTIPVLKKFQNAFQSEKNGHIWRFTITPYMAIFYTLESILKFFKHRNRVPQPRKP